MNDLGEFLLVMFGVMGIPFGLIFGIMYIVDINQCSTFMQVTGHPTHYAGLTCYVKYGDEYRTMKQYERTIERNMNLRVTP